MNNPTETLIKALRSMPAPEPRPEFVDRAIATATRANVHAGPGRAGGLRRAATRWETWFGAALGGAVAATLTLLIMRPDAPTEPARGITLALNEARDIDVIIESDRDLEDATIRIAVTGAVALDGFQNEHIIDWRADLERGGNLLSLPVVAHQVGYGQLVAVIEHGGRTRTVTVDLRVNDV